MGMSGQKTQLETRPQKKTYSHTHDTQQWHNSIITVSVCYHGYAE